MDKHTAIARLCRLCPPGTTIYVIRRSISRSGQTQTLDLITIGLDRVPVYLTREVAIALELATDKSEAMVVRGWGDYAGQYVVHQLSLALHGMLPSHADGVCPDATTAGATCPGYTLHHEWL